MRKGRKRKRKGSGGETYPYPVRKRRIRRAAMDKGIGLRSTRAGHTRYSLSGERSPSCKSHLRRDADSHLRRTGAAMVLGGEVVWSGAQGIPLHDVQVTL
jgi:hypothetical protein